MRRFNTLQYSPKVVFIDLMGCVVKIQPELPLKRKSCLIIIFKGIRDVLRSYSLIFIFNGIRDVLRSCFVF